MAAHSHLCVHKLYYKLAKWLWGKCFDLCLSYQWCQTYSYIYYMHISYISHPMKHSHEYDLQIRFTPCHSVIHSACTFIHTHTTHSTQIWNHKRDNQPSSIVLNRKTGFYSESASLYAFRGAACFLEHSGVAGKGQRFLQKSGWGAPKSGNTQYPKYYLDLIESEAKGERARESSWAIWPTMLHNA